MKLTGQEWRGEKRKGFKKALPANGKAEIVSAVIELMDKETFNFAEFKRLMGSQSHQRSAQL